MVDNLPFALPAGLPGAVEWRRDTAPVPYRAALAEMAARNAAIADGTAQELVWLLEHPSVYTAGTSAAAAELLDPRFDVVEAGRGGRYTYHGPGQRIGYVLVDLRRRARDVRGFVHALEGWVIDTLADLSVQSWRSEGRIGIWTRDIDGREAKIGAIGVRIRRWVTMHGFSVNLSPDLSHFAGIVPCGIEEFGVTSLARLGRAVSADQWDAALLARASAFLAKLDIPCPPAPSGDPLP
ncbi:MAG: lipoyl(octanoyl) transferase LipB [Pseudomonadota bacterium]